MKEINMKLAPNRPSRKHIWKHMDYSKVSGSVDRCERCGSIFVEKADSTASRYCFPKPQWLKDHPDDDRKEF